MDCSLKLLSAMVLTSLHFLFLHYWIIGDNEHRGTGLKDTIMQFWKRRRNKHIHDYSLVGYILSPNPTIMEQVIGNKTLAHDEAAERLITKLLLDPSLVGNARTQERAKLIDYFMEEYGDFTNRRDMIARDNIWIIAADHATKAYKWHHKYSYHQGIGKVSMPCARKDPWNWDR